MASSSYECTKLLGALLELVRWSCLVSLDIVQGQRLTKRRSSNTFVPPKPKRHPKSWHDRIYAGSNASL